MKKILGLDLGTNSIGWAIVENNEITDFGSRIFSHKNIIKKEKNVRKFKKLIKENFQFLSLLFITITMFILSIILIEFWQLFLNLGIGGTISILTLQNKKSK